MKNLHIEKFTINDTNVDFNTRLKISEAIRFLQVVTFNHSNLIGLDHVTMQNKSNAFWIVTKMKLNFKNNITTGDNIKVYTWTQPLSSIRAIRDFKIKLKNSVMVKAVAEWCCLDYNTRKIRKLNSIAYPDLEMVETSSNNLEFSKVNYEIDETNYVYTKIIRSSDIDVNNHTNNLVYNTMALDAFSLDELNSMIIKDYEIHFVGETYFKEEVKIYKKKIGQLYYIEGKVENKTVFKVFIKTKKKESN